MSQVPEPQKDVTKTEKKNSKLKSNQIKSKHKSKSAGEGAN